MKAINYRGQNDFYLFDKPEMPTDMYIGDQYYGSLMDEYHEKLKANLSAGKRKIINPEVMTASEMPICMNSSGQWIHAQTCVHLKPGDIFPLPENIGFEEEEICDKGSCAHSGMCYADGLSFETCAAKKWIRLFLKDEIKPSPPVPNMNSNGLEPLMPVKQPKPSPVETQDELWNEFCLKLLGFSVMDRESQRRIKELKSKFTISRKP